MAQEIRTISRLENNNNYNTQLSICNTAQQQSRVCRIYHSKLRTLQLKEEKHTLGFLFVVKVEQKKRQVTTEHRRESKSEVKNVNASDLLCSRVCVCPCLDCADF